MTTIIFFSTFLIVLPFRIKNCISFPLSSRSSELNISWPLASHQVPMSFEIPSLCLVINPTTDISSTPSGAIFSSYTALHDFKVPGRPARLSDLSACELCLARPAKCLCLIESKFVRLQRGDRIFRRKFRLKDSKHNMLVRQMKKDNAGKYIYTHRNSEIRMML
ncbi:uncharacterized protein BKA55DRAFT_710501 [Fusarium redolens]|uniref:Uncharacterized protein n=1 Tax=Fusarium redolens TaxID=48865 RepID=A0A9P9JX95_FUSRE|nr:uncharacterized protein BKA55DRAFT_710501 [Fusarium redolens]KAH7232184.1 hypothetical protein BKA55DRAFT_710501 [Fusarium redolens]